MGDLGRAREDSVVLDTTASDGAPSDRVRALVTLARSSDGKGSTTMPRSMGTKPCA